MYVCMFALFLAVPEHANTVTITAITLPVTLLPTVLTSGCSTLQSLIVQIEQDISIGVICVVCHKDREATLSADGGRGWESQ